ncbi:uncharacterized protein LOC127004273, partial [Eriocheir sinensis]|uniref:uncharacterized protein LOC127004273 n=1 Tax=Eriocheir sinensis TaxID=95602 RepID=UPI0021C99EF0
YPPPSDNKNVAEPHEPGFKAYTNEDILRNAGGEAAEGESKRDDLDEEGKKLRFLGHYSTTTETAVVMVTSTVFFSCLSGTSTALCLGRRKKKNLQSLMELQVNPEEGVYLDSSQVTNTGREARSIDDALEASSAAAEDEAEAGPRDSDAKNQTKLFGFQIWTRTRITTTVTMLFTDSNTTIRLSYYCQAGNLQLPQFNCV